MELHERLKIFFERLRSAPTCRTAEEALEQTCRVMEEVENEFCEIPIQRPPPQIFTGRMYRPQPDRIFRSDDGHIRAETRRHTLHFSPDGSIRIIRTGSGMVEFSKPAPPL